MAAVAAACQRAVQVVCAVHPGQDSAVARGQHAVTQRGNVRHVIKVNHLRPHGQWEQQQGTESSQLSWLVREFSQLKPVSQGASQSSRLAAGSPVCTHACSTSGRQAGMPHAAGHTCLHTHVRQEAGGVPACLPVQCACRNKSVPTPRAHQACLYTLASIHTRH